MNIIWKNENPALITHNNYIECLKIFSNNLSIKIKNLPTQIIVEKGDLKRKVHLVKLTYSNLIWEQKSIQDNPEYATVCASWISIKAYYIFFNFLMVIEYLLSDEVGAFRYTHKKTIKIFKEYIKEGKIQFSAQKFNKIYFPDEINSWAIPKSENIKTFNVDLDVREKQIIRKLLNYCQEDYKKANKLKKLCKNNKIEFNKKTTLCLFEFFYWYRIKANYCDLEFINSNTSPEDYVKFYDNYFYLTMHFSKAFMDIINVLSQNRLNKKLF